MLAACVGITWLLVDSLDGPLESWQKGDYVPTHDVRLWAVAVAAAWAVGYALTSPPAGQRAPVAWGDPWRPLVGAYDGILRPAGVRSFLHGLVSAVPVNVLLVCAGSLTAARLGYVWGNGSQARDNFFAIVFVVLALAGLALSFVPARRR